MTTKLLEFAPKGQRGDRPVNTPAEVVHMPTNAPIPKDSRPWKVRFLIFAGLLCFVWYQVAKQLGWLN